MVDAVRQHGETQKLERGLAGEAYDDRDLVFCNQLGGAIQPPGAYGHLRVPPQSCRHPDRTLHILRHTAATIALTEGVPLHVVAGRLGDRAETLLATYAHLLPHSDEVAAETGCRGSR